MLGNDDTRRGSGLRVTGAHIVGRARVSRASTGTEVRVIDAVRVRVDGDESVGRIEITVPHLVGEVQAVLVIADGEVRVVSLRRAGAVCRARIRGVDDRAVFIVVAAPTRVVLERLRRRHRPPGSRERIEPRSRRRPIPRGLEAAPPPPPPAPAPRRAPTPAPNVGDAPPDEVPLEMADMAEMAEPAPEPAPEMSPRHAPVRAHVGAEMPATLVQHREFEVRVRLSRRALTPTRGTAHAEDVIDLDPSLPVQISVSGRGIQHPDDAPAVQELTLPEEDDDEAVAVFRLIATDLPRAVVSIAVRQGDIDLPLTTFRLSATVVAEGTEPDDELVVHEGTATGRPTEIVELPSIRIDETLTEGRSTLTISVSAGGERAECTTPLDDKAAFVADVYARLVSVRDAASKITDADERRERATELLQRVGERIARTLFDERVADLLWRHRDDLDGLIVQTADELDVPWEVVHLAPPPGTPSDGGVWFLADTGLTRWVYDAPRPREVRVAPARVRTLAPEYVSPSLRLQRTDDEVAALRAHLPGAPEGSRDATAAELRDVITAGFDLLHFAGHGRWHDLDPRGQQLILAAHDPADAARASTYNESDARDDLPELGGGDTAPPASMVFLSACHVGRLQSGEPGSGGFAEAFLRGGAGVFVGCNWAVADDVASQFVDVFYRGLLIDGLPVGESAKQARADARRGGDLSALAFTVFADPRTVVSVT
ncbi:CHAT domain-containing protein [Microbacterium sp. C7(2022)]|uniref:DUF7363 domain-containing protein n=1 Tax=Microbacterium sp. C7(2022) TaxID=2992759 RepID=UPI00237AA4BB|nr:CHAT domain-containing protein [Microbacterium sp. C7(2022)]MDE0545296.1 CHAT domain-containing protein [Microbacterium sp. C7(2022)]